MTKEVANVPCSTCPYAKSTPPGVWADSEYVKLPEYDRETPYQPYGSFLCHHGDGKELLCAGWLAVHGKQGPGYELIALRLANLPPEFYEYETSVELFASGQEAHDHGVSGMDERTVAAQVKAQRAKDRRRRNG